MQFITSAKPPFNTLGQHAAFIPSERGSEINSSNELTTLTQSNEEMVGREDGMPLRIYPTKFEMGTMEFNLCRRKPTAGK
jgi:hypothetical protein